jgi:hypothetical protein
LILGGSAFYFIFIKILLSILNLWIFLRNFTYLNFIYVIFFFSVTVFFYHFLSYLCLLFIKHQKCELILAPVLPLCKRSPLLKLPTLTTCLIINDFSDAISLLFFLDKIKFLLNFVLINYFFFIICLIKIFFIAHKTSLI